MYTDVIISEKEVMFSLVFVSFVCLFATLIKKLQADRNEILCRNPGW